MKRFDINVNLEQAQAIEWFLQCMVEDNDVDEFCEAMDLTTTDFNEMYGEVRKAVVNLCLAEEIAKRGIEKTGSTQNAEDVASVINACSDLGLLKIKNNQ